VNNIPISNLPSGTVTFLFTDIEGSTILAQEHPEAMKTSLARHNDILRTAIETNGGYVFQIVGDSFCAAFHRPGDALKAAVKAQIDLSQAAWGDAAIKVRMGIHTGEAEVQSSGDYQGYLALSRVQRLMSAGHGGQVLISQVTQELACDDLPKGTSLQDMGERRLKDLMRPEHIYQLNIAGLATEFPALKTLDKYRHNLPAQLTSFIGREKEIAEIKKALSEHRLVTLTGSGGAGKTRLSLQVTEDVLDSFPNGIWLVELAPLTEPSLIPQTILSAAGIQAQQGYLAMERLIDFLREKTSLLVLDNCEHLLEACARLVETLLNAAPNLRVLASSREALGVKGEQAWRIPSLSTPDIKYLPPFEQLLQYESVRLFIDRALLVQPHFVLTNENAPTVAKICQRLDGIPLAIELAAARLRMLSVEQVAARLDDRFRLLTGGTRTALPRQQTLRALIDWSYDLLSEDERTLLCRLAVFSGGWVLEAAEQVCSGGNIKTDDVLDLLDHLVDKSLVVVDVGQNQETRYRTMETIRQYAREKLSERGESAPNRTRHLAYFLKLVRDIEPGLRGPQQVELLNRMEKDIDNLRAALEWSQDSDPESGLQMASMLKWFWHFCGLFEEGTVWLEGVLAFSKESGIAIDPLLKARSLSVLAWLSFWSGDVQTAMTSVSESLDLCKKYQGPISDLITADNFYIYSTIVFQRGGDLGQAKLIVEKGLALYQALGNKFGIAEMSSALFGNAFISGDLETASHWNEAAIHIRKELGDKDGLAYDLTLGAAIPLSRRDYNNTRRMLAAAVEACRETRYEFDLVLALGFLGVTCLFDDNVAQALDYFLQVVTLSYEKSNTIFKTLSIYYLVLLLLGKKQHRTTVQLNAAMEELKTYNIILIYDIPMVHDTLQQYLLEAREALGEVDFNAACAEGRAMTLDQAIAYALKELGL
jgi:predicted ATPase/class 3 adenylate cyclase